jgi:hypothetical protein
MHNILNKGIIENTSRSLLNPRGQKCKSINQSCNCSKALIESRYKGGIFFVPLIKVAGLQVNQGYTGVSSTQKGKGRRTGPIKQVPKNKNIVIIPLRYQQVVST